MALEILSFGQLSLLFKNVNLTTSKKEIASYFGVHYKLLESWFEALSYVRNVCAHHSRLWNKKVPKPPIYPNRINHKWLEIEPSEDKKNRLYIILAIIDLLLFNIEKNYEFRKELFSLIDQNLEIPLHYIGFPVGWQSDSFWQNSYENI
jgi:abortive infection bacteriophage resistance protein